MMSDTRLPPRWIAKSLERFRSGLLSLHQSVFPGNVVLYEKFQYLYLLPPLYVAAEIDLACIIGNRKVPVDDLAQQTGMDPGSLYRTLRVLASHRIFREDPGRMFSNTRLSRTLIDGHGSLRNMVRHHLGPLNWNILGDLLETVRSGTDSFNRKYGKNIYDYLSGDPGSMSVFDQSMADLSSLALAPLLQAYDFSRFNTLVDIGGGNGLLLSEILRTNPGLRGILFDLPDALAGFSPTTVGYGVGDRIQTIPGSFFGSVPQGADGYMLKHVLHNWNDQRCTTILANIREAMPERGRLLVIEMLVPAGNRPSTAKMVDIQMLSSMPGGKERTLQEYTGLFRLAGLHLSREYSTVAPFSVLEVRLKP